MKHCVSLFDCTAEMQARSDLPVSRKRTVLLDYKPVLAQQMPFEDFIEGGGASIAGELITGREIPPVPIPVAIQIPSKRPRNRRCTKASSPMDAFCFTDIFNPFNSLSPADLTKLYNVFAASFYQMPPKREVRNLSVQLGIPQTKVKQWFNVQRKGHKMAIDPRPPAVMDIIQVIEQRTGDFQAVLDRLANKTDAALDQANGLVHTSS